MDIGTAFAFSAPTAVGLAALGSGIGLGVAIGKAVEAQRAGEREGVPAIDQPPVETALCGGKLVEMDPGGVLVEPRRDLVFGFLNGDAVDVVDALADLVVSPKEL